MFSGMWIGVGFQIEFQLIFCYTTVGVKSGFMAMSFAVAPSWKFIAKIDNVATPTHYYNSATNLSTPRCPIKSTTQKFPRLVVRASWYSLAFDLSYLNLGKILFCFNCMLWLNKAAIDVQPYVQRLVVKVSPHYAIADVIYYHFEVRNNLPNCRWTNNIIDSVTPPIYQENELPWFVTRRPTIEDE